MPTGQETTCDMTSGYEADISINNSHLGDESIHQNISEGREITISGLFTQSKTGSDDDDRREHVRARLLLTKLARTPRGQHLDKLTRIKFIN